MAHRHCRICSGLFPGLTATLVIAVFTVLLSCRRHLERDTERYVVMISLDGFRYDYPDLYTTPVLDSIEENGVRAVSMQPSFPTKTFPNHYTLVTGLYPDHHGLVNNNFFDPELNMVYSIGNRERVEDGRFYGGEPIWITAEKQGYKTGSYFWVGSEAPAGGGRPTLWKKYDHHFPYTQRVDSVIAWLGKPSELRPHLVTWYVDQPDGWGHDLGPEDPALNTLIGSLDRLLGYFFSRLRTLDIYPNTDVIITSDHGMESISAERWINLTDYLEPAWFSQVTGSNPVYNLWIKEEYDSLVFNHTAAIPHVHTWRSEDIPERLHYGTNTRCGDLTLVADSAWSISWRDPRPGFSGGTHGYDPANRNMHAIFYACGPDFKKHYHQPVFENVDVYLLICNLLNLTPAKNDGNFDHVRDMLHDKQK